MNKYSRLTKKERYHIEKGIKARASVRSIAQSIGRSPKTVAAEIARNGGYLRYYAEKAHFERNRSNRKGYSKIAAHKQLVVHIREKLMQKWSPEVIAGRWNKEHADLTISHEAIYQWIYKQNDMLYQALSRHKKQRGFKPQRKNRMITHRTSIHERAETVNQRLEIGHYEGDLVFQKGNQSQNILSVIERVSRKVFLRKNSSKHAAIITAALQEIEQNNPKKMCSLTLDNGSEFAYHRQLNMPTYFCDPGKPWQKGAVENLNGIVRRYIDYRTKAETITQKMLDLVADQLNNKPRKILGFSTPNEVFEQTYKQKCSGVTF